MEVATRRREQEVWQACDDLWAISGDLGHLTGDAIRERLVALGKSRGSPNEIYKYRKTWVSSRGVSAKSSTEESTDPIFRAVRIVHENLQNESLEKIEALKAEHEQELFKKEEELELQKKAIDSLMEEYQAQKRGMEQISAELQVKSLEHMAEVEIRKALEREIELEKTLNKQVLLGKAEVLRELKDAHTLEIAKINKRIDDLLSEKKLLGQEYSEQLTAQKIALYNQEALTKEQAKIASVFEQELMILREKILERDSKITWLMNENNKMADLIRQKSAELLAQKAGFDLALSGQRNLVNSLKRAELEVAKLRVMSRLLSSRPQ